MRHRLRVPRGFLPVAITGLWLALICGNYFLGLGTFIRSFLALRPLPFPPLSVSAAGFIAALRSDLLGALGAVLVALAALGMGRPACGSRRAGPVSGLLMPAVLGAGLLGTAMAGMGFAGILRPSLVGAVVVVAASFGLLLLREARRGRAPAGPFRPLLLAVSGFAVLSQVTSALSPEIEVDSLYYHLGRAADYLRTGRFTVHAYGFHTEFNALWECLLAPALLLGGESGARLLNPLAAVVTAGLLARAVPGAGLLAGTLFLASMATGAVANTCKNDLAVAVFGLAAFSCAGRPTRPGAVIAGAAAGFALSVKLTAYVSVIPAFLALLLSRRPYRMGRFIAAGALTFAPWLLRNWLALGNPLFPAASSLLGGGLSDLERVTLREETWGYLLCTYPTLAAKAAAPWTLLTGRCPATILPALALAGLAAVALRGKAASSWAIAALTSFMLWLGGPPQIRFLVQALPFMAGVAALGIPAMLPSARHRRAAVLALAALAAAEAGVAWLDPSVDRPARALVAAGVVPPRSYLWSRLPAFAQAAEVVADRLPASATVLLYGELRAFPLRHRTIVPWYGKAVPFLEMARDSGDERRLTLRLRQLGITHFLCNRTHAAFRRAYLARFNPDERAMALWAGWWRGHARLVYEPPVISVWTGSYTLYALDRRGGRPGPRPLLLPGLEAWLNRPEELVTAGRTEEALADFSRIERVAGAFAMVKLAKAVIFERALPRARAKALLKEARGAGLRSVTLLVTLARYAREEGDEAGARRLLEEAVRLDPEFRPR